MNSNEGFSVTIQPSPLEWCHPRGGVDPFICFWHLGRESKWVHASAGMTYLGRFSSNSRLKSYGFSLVELAVVLLILSIIASVGFSYLPKKIAAEQILQTNKKLDFIEDALAGFLSQNGRLPCPADGSKNFTDKDFGKEETIKDGCAHKFSVDGVSLGMVPVTSLLISDHYSYDAWKNRIIYAVKDSYSFSKNLDRQNYESNFSNQKECTNCISILNASAKITTSNAIVILLSYGQNGRNANFYGNRQELLSDDELFNLSLTKDKNPRDKNIFVQKNAINIGPDYFDDLLRYKTRDQLIAASGGLDVLNDSNICNNFLEKLNINEMCNSNLTKAQEECKSSFTDLSDSVKKLCF